MYADQNLRGSYFVFRKMVVNEVDFKRALKSVSDSFKIPWLYSIEALFKGKDVFASLPTGYGSDLQSSTDRCR